MTIPNFRKSTETERVGLFDSQIRETQRAGTTNPERMRHNVEMNLSYIAGDLRREWAARNKPAHIRSSQWDDAYRQWRKDHNCPELTEADKIRCDAEDRKTASEDRTQARANVRKALDQLRWGRFILDRLNSPEIIAEIAQGPSYELLHWGKRSCDTISGRVLNAEPTLYDAKGRIVATITREPSDSKGPTIKASILATPGATTSPPVDWALLRTRKQAIRWLTEQFHRKHAIRLFGNEADIPEFTP